MSSIRSQFPFGLRAATAAGPLVAASGAHATVVDLTAAFTSGSSNSAIFSTASPHAAGTG